MGAVDRNVRRIAARPAPRREQRNGYTRTEQFRFDAHAKRLDNTRHLDARHHRQHRRLRIAALAHQRFEEVDARGAHAHQHFSRAGNGRGKVDGFEHVGGSGPA